MCENLTRSEIKEVTMLLCAEMFFSASEFVANICSNISNMSLQKDFRFSRCTFLETSEEKMHVYIPSDQADDTDASELHCFIIAAPTASIDKVVDEFFRSMTLGKTENWKCVDTTEDVLTLGDDSATIQIGLLSSIYPGLALEGFGGCQRGLEYVSKKAETREPDSNEAKFL